MKIIVFASGNGTNAENIFDYCKLSDHCSVELLVSDDATAGVLKRAEKFAIPSKVIEFNRAEFSSYKEAKLDQEKRLSAILKDLEYDWLCLAGYMRIFSKEFIETQLHSSGDYSKIVNIHPSLLPSFKGRDAYTDAFDYGVKVSGITTHLVESEIDSGPILLQKSFPRLESDTLAEFRTRGMEVEYVLYRQTLENLSTKKFTYTHNEKGRLVTWPK